MTPPKSDIPVLSDRELTEVLTRAREEQWRELALVLASARPMAEEVLRARRPADRIFAVESPLVGRVHEVASIASITALDLPFNNLGDEGALALARMSSLEALDLSFNQLGVEGARALARLTNLTFLDLRASRLGAEGARALAALSRLQGLSLGGNEIGERGAREVGAMEALEELLVDDNDLGDEGVRSLASLPNLRVLGLSSNELSADAMRVFAASTRSLSSLAYLDLSMNEVGDEGAEALSRLSKLTHLVLTHGGLGAEGARALAALSSLTYLNLRGNSIEAEGARGLASLKNLSELFLEGADLGDEGALALGSLTGLTQLDLGRNGIRGKGAVGLAGLLALTFLDLRGNGIGAKGAEALIGLSNLAELNLSHNGVRDRGARAVAKLKKLTHLVVDRNEIGPEGARALATLPNLVDLDLHENGLGDEGARALSRLKGLRRLNVSYNKIGDEGARALASMPSLASLSITDNEVGDEGARALASSKGLGLLYASDNRITDARPFSSAPSLWSLTLSGNPIADVPPGLLNDRWNGCLSALQAYWHDLDRGGAPNRVAKVLLIGNGYVGKTTLAHCLNWGAAPQEPITERTHGIERQKIELELPREGRVDVWLWDFGGQERYHAMHRLFVHGKAIYLVVWAEETKESRDEEPHPVGYWLDMIRHLAPGAEVLLVKNKIDRSNEHGRPPDLEGHELGDVGQIEVSAIRYQHIDALRASLAELVERSRHRWGYLLPESWRKVRDDLNTWRQPGAEGDDPPPRTITLGRFEQLCVEHGVEHPGVLLGFLRDTGEVFHRPGRFNDSIILDQNWFIDAIYRLFDQKSGAYGRAHRQLRGELKGADFKEFWRGEGEAECETYFDFMLQTGMAFEPARDYSAPFAERVMVVPALLPALDPAREPWGVAAPGEAWVRLEYPFLHRGQVERVIVDLSRLSEGHQWWRDGLLFADRQTGCTFFLRASTPDGRIDLRLRGGRQYEAFTRVLATLGKLLDQPPQRTLVSPDGEAFVAIEALEEAFRRGESTVSKGLGGAVARAPYDRFVPFAHPPESAQEFVFEVPTAKPTRIFIICSHEKADRPYLEQLETRLKVLGRRFLLDVWHDSKVLAGLDRAEEIYQRLAVADIVLLLVSPDFMASDECFLEQTKHALAKYEEERGAVVPIYARPESSWRDHPLGRHQALPGGDKAISQWSKRDDAWAKVSEGLRALLEARRAPEHGTGRPGLRGGN